MNRTSKISGLILIVLLALVCISCSKQSQTAAKVNLNTATVQQLQKVPGIDRTLAQNIVAFRDMNGPFNSVDDLAKVQGMDQKKLDSLRDNVMVSGPSESGKEAGQGPRSSQSAPQQGSGK